MITLFLMSKKGLRSLQSVIDNNLSNQIDKVVSSRDSSISKDYYKEIKDLCQKNNILFYDKGENFKVESEYVFAISWRWMLDCDKSNLIVFHDSLLPKYRGFNPLVSCLLNRENKIGVTALFASEEFDTGPIISQSSSTITYPIKLDQAIDVICENYSDLCIEIIKKIKSKTKLNAKPQNNSDASYSVWRDEEDYKIDWSKSAEDICSIIDSLGYPYLGASCYIEGQKVRILEAEVYENLLVENRSPGKLLLKKGDFPVIICGKGLLLVKKAVYDESKENIFPLKKFRIRFS
jgi:methionyl-tRNA formyltransferase